MNDGYPPSQKNLPQMRWASIEVGPSRSSRSPDVITSAGSSYARPVAGNVWATAPYIAV